MKMTVVGVQRIAGTAKGSGNAFDMCNLTALVPVEVVNSPKIQINGAGSKPMEIPLDVAALPEFMSLKFPGIYDLVIEPRPRSGKFESVVVGLVPQLPKAA